MQTIIFAGMKRPRTTYLSLIAVLFAAILASCSDAVDHGGKSPLVSAGDEYLYREDIEQLLALNSNVKDSAAFVDRYIKQWLEDALFYEYKGVECSNGRNRGCAAFRMAWIHAR